MLKHLHLKHFTIISELELTFDKGLTMLTGETGAGKSILIDALEMLLGQRADITVIANGQDRCELTAVFEITAIPAAQRWLLEQDLEEGDECLIRRVINRDGRSRNSVNGRPCSLNQLRELGFLLVHIHSQNEQSALLKNQYQRELLDHFAQHMSLIATVHQHYEEWRKIHTELTYHHQTASQGEAQQALLSFQLQELIAAELRPDEWPRLLQEQRQLTHAAQWIYTCQHTLDILTEQEEVNVLKNLHAAHQQLTQITQQTASLNTATELLNQAIIQTQEASTEVRHYLNGIELNPERLQTVEQRITLLHELARKNKVAPENLLMHQQLLEQKRQQLTTLDQQLAELKAKRAFYAKKYDVTAKQLTHSRLQAAKQLNAHITALLHMLGITQGEFKVQLTPYSDIEPHPDGHDHIEFLISTNPGQPLQLLNKIASGGELSRIALAIQVATVQKNTLPTIIFDEVDVGVGGRTAQIIGEQLRTLGENAQVLCVTHSPQVAAQGHQHLRVQKSVNQGKVQTTVQKLTLEERMAEIARMLGGVTITNTTLAHAREMLKFSDSV